MLRSVLMVCVWVAATSASEWSTIDQAKLHNPSSVSVSPDSKWLVYVVGTVSGVKGNLTATGSLFVGPVSAVTQPTPLAFCETGSCSSPVFAADSSLVFLSGSVLYRSQLAAGRWADPTKLEMPAPVPDTAILAYAVSPDMRRVAFTYAEMGEYSSSEAREITDDVIVDVIVGAPTPTRNVLCVAETGWTGGRVAAHCYDKLAGSAGMEGWRISCWPYDSQFTWDAASKLVAVTTTDSLKANDWESVRIVLVDATAHTGDGLTGLPMLGNISFQPVFQHVAGAGSPSLLAFTQADSSREDPKGYTWAQTWRICVMQLPGGQVTCDEEGTLDAMATLVGWVGDAILYMEQNGTEVSLFSKLWLGNGFGSYSRVDGGPKGGVLGGGFRATSRATLNGAGWLGFTWEDVHTPIEVYAANMILPTQISAKKMSFLNKGAAGLQWPEVTVQHWNSNDGQRVEGLLVHAQGGRIDAPAPLIVFTHCGPAMASLATFIGAGTVCARFPIATWAQRGYNVLLPNYRGSSGYGRSFRRGDLDGWGAGDYEDVMSGFVSLAQQGLASLNNCAHVGWSYGGYTSAVALTKAKATHGIELKAVITGGTITDLFSQTGTTDISKIYRSSNSNEYYWDDSSGLLQSHFLSRSAMYHVANATAATLIFHGQRDPRVPISQSFQLNYALKALGVTSRFLVFPGAGHIPGDPNQIVRVWDESLQWIQTNLPPAV